MLQTNPKITLIESSVNFDTASLSKIKLGIVNNLSKYSDEKNVIIHQKLSFSKEGKLLEKNILDLMKQMKHIFYFSNMNAELITTFTNDFENELLQEYKVEFDNLYQTKKFVLHQYEAYRETEFTKFADHDNPLLKDKGKRFDNLNQPLEFLISDATHFDLNIFNIQNEQLKPNLNLNPFFQRDLVWSLAQKQDLMKSLFYHLPIGAIYINRHNYLNDTIVNGIKHFKNKKDLNYFSEIDNVVVDGKQRLSTVLSFLNDEFPIIINNNEIYRHDMSKFDIANLLNNNINVIQTYIENRNDLIKFYVQINTSQTTHNESEIDFAKSFLE